MKTSATREARLAAIAAHSPPTAFVHSLIGGATGGTGGEGGEGGGGGGDGGCEEGGPYRTHETSFHHGVKSRGERWRSIAKSIAKS